jgi:MFS family permease
VFLTAGPVWQLLVGRALSGLSAGVFTGTATVAIVEAAAPQWRSRAAIVATIANMGGLGLGPVTGGLLVQYLRWPLHLAFVCHLALLMVACLGLLRARETAIVTSGGRLTVRSLVVPAQVRATFVPAAIATFAGFAVLGLFTAVAPAFLAQILDIHNVAVAGIVVSAVFFSSALAQIATGPMRTSTALPLGCVVLVAGMVFILLALLHSSAVLLVIGAVTAGAGQGISFSKSVRSVTDAALAHHRAGVTSTLFVIAYLALSIPVVGEGLAAHAWGLRTAGIVFAATVAVLAVAAAGGCCSSTLGAPSGPSLRRPNPVDTSPDTGSTTNGTTGMDRDRAPQRTRHPEHMESKIDW